MREPLIFQTLKYFINRNIKSLQLGYNYKGIGKLRFVANVQLLLLIDQLR